MLCVCDCCLLVVVRCALLDVRCALCVLCRSWMSVVVHCLPFVV